MTIYSGTFTAVITPFDDNDKLDVVAFKQILKWQIENGVSGLVVSGSTGESANLTEDEYIELIRNARKITKDKVPLIVGAGLNTTSKTINQVKIAEEAGADGVILVTPYYNKPTQKGMYYHFKEVAASTDLPIMLYNVPGRAVVSMNVETVADLAEIPNIVAIKESTNDVTRFAELSAISSNFDVLCGDDNLTLPARSLGAKGCVSVVSNILPDSVVKLNALCDEQMYSDALEIHNRIYKITDLMFIESNPIPVKYAMSVLGLCKNNLRMPLIPLDSKLETKVKDELRKFYEL
ncbi:MAG: 4-hydroxy-tetrahydrodipicolinate synthase [Alphaproteobacteria bacterium]|nr:4-hydroxy-tetrahydrodipicolinate synthase [Alphaproteobacteria bacterium]OJV12144.1 MAG: 4-hydroxy-tetrahydrodipicolinate synthase [Alphaproteobacteria bacterium 33-17]